jgi:hypothetical protein
VTLVVERIYHTWEKWECYPAGFYEDRPLNGESVEWGEEKYREFLSDLDAFEAALIGLTTEWKYSCEHYLSNENMNRIAWLGQASMTYAHGVPSNCRGGFNRLSKEQQEAANALALKYLNLWMQRYGEPELTWETAKSKTKMDLY